MTVRWGGTRRHGRNTGTASSGGGVSDVLSYTAPDFKAGGDDDGNWPDYRKPHIYYW